MPVTTIIDIDFHYSRRRGIDIEERVIVPLGSNVVWRFKVAEDQDFRTRFYLRLNVELYFERDSPFRWRTKSIRYISSPDILTPVPAEITSEVADSEGEYKYGVRVTGEGTNERIEYDEDPYLIIRRF